MSIDPITLEVLRNRFDVIADEMELTLLRASFSPIVKEAQDASSALFTTEGEVIAQAAAIPIHLGCLIPSVERLIAAFPVSEMNEGDAFIMNDPYEGGTHLPDTTIVQPIISDCEVVALAATMTHHQDVGGKAPGSIPTDATDIFQEGICIPPLKFYDRGRINEVLRAILIKNVRLPDVLMGDLHGQLAAGHVAITRWTEMLKEYGRDTVSMAIRELSDRAESATRAHLAAIPDGTYTFSDYLDNDGVVLNKAIKICVAVTIADSDITFDFSGSSPQVTGPLNSVTAATMSGAYYVLRVITDPSIPNNGGCYRMAKFVYPEGSIVNPSHPAPVNARALTIARIADAIRGALIKALPERLIAADSGHLTLAFGGINEATGRQFVTSEMGAGGAGARLAKDGVDVIDFGPVNCMNIPVEAIEMDSPLRIEMFRMRDNSGGAGRQRGGLGAEKIFGVRSGSVSVTVRGERFFTPPWGVFGGCAGDCGRAWVERGDGSREVIQSKRILTLSKGDRLFFQTPGGGGYGNPVERDPELVLRDVLDRKVSIEAAEEMYGVVIRDERIDAEKTARLREELASGRNTNLTFDHGKLGKSTAGELEFDPAERFA